MQENEELHGFQFLSINVSEYNALKIHAFWEWCLITGKIRFNSLGMNLTINDYVCQFITKLYGKHIDDP